MVRGHIDWLAGWLAGWVVCSPQTKQRATRAAGTDRPHHPPTHPRHTPRQGGRQGLARAGPRGEAGAGDPPGRRAHPLHGACARVLCLLCFALLFFPHSLTHSAVPALVSFSHVYTHTIQKHPPTHTSIFTVRQAGLPPGLPPTLSPSKNTHPHTFLKKTNQKTNNNKTVRQAGLPPGRAGQPGPRGAADILLPSAGPALPPLLPDWAALQGGWCVCVFLSGLHFKVGGVYAVGRCG